MSLSTGELIFLKSLDGCRVNGQHPNYFKYSHHIDCQECVKRFYDAGLIEYAPVAFTVNRQSINNLKEAAEQLGVSLKKKRRADIIDQLLAECSETALTNIFPDKYYILTLEGKSALEGLSDDDYENRYEPLIKVEEIKTAMQLIGDPEKMINYIRANIIENIYTLHSINETISDYLKRDNDLSNEEKAFFVVITICGSRHERAARAYKKVFEVEKSAAEVYTQIHTVHSIDSIICGSNIAKKLKNSGMKYAYRIHTIDDECVCKFCQSMKGFEFNYLDAELGVNYPPFDKCESEFCRCRVSADMIKTK